MTNIFDFGKEKKKSITERDQYVIGPDGDYYFKYKAEYKFQDHKESQLPDEFYQSDDVIIPDTKTFEIEFFARDDDEAEDRVRAMKDGLELKGQVIAKIEGGGDE